jgi:Mg2+ and Co2+ transporter CorA
MEVSRNATLNQASILNLGYLRKILDDHVTGLTETVLLLTDRDQLEWPRAPVGLPQRATADRMGNVLLRDFTQLSQRAERLSKSCQKGIQSLANDAAFKESAKSVQNAGRLERLTLLATIFVPLTFTCSLFGMNFAVFGQGTLSIWIFFPVAVGMVAATFLLWYLYGGSFLVGKAPGST